MRNKHIALVAAAVAAAMPLSATVRGFVGADGEQGKLNAGQTVAASGSFADVPAQPRQYAPARIGATGSTIYGFMSYADIDGFNAGWYEIEPSGNATRLWQYAFAESGARLSNGWLRGGRLCGLGLFTMGSEDMIGDYAYQEFDLETGELLTNRSIDVISYRMPHFYSAAYVPSEDKIYGFGKGESSESDLHYFKCAPADKPEEAVIIKQLSQPGDRCFSLCYSPVDNCFYGVNCFGKFVRILTNGTITELFDVPVADLANSKGALAYSPYDGYLIWNPSVYAATSELYAIYPAENRIEKIHQFDVDTQFTFFLTPDVQDNMAAPRPGRFISAQFEDAQLSGTLRFAMPDHTMQDSSISGDIDWRLYDNGTLLKSGTAPAAENVTIPVEVAQGDHTFRFAAVLNGIEGNPAVAHVYVGHDTPKVPEQVVLTSENVTWMPVTEGVHGGYMDAANVTYEVYLNGEKAGETSANSFPVNIDADREQDVYRASVVAVSHDMRSDAGISDKAIIGRPYALPMTIAPTEHDAEMVTIINADGSPEYGVWRFSDQWQGDWGTYCFASGWSYNQPDDWLIMPAAEFPSNEVLYQVTLDVARGSYSGQREYFEVWAGTAPTVEAMTIPVIAKTRAQKYNEWKEYSGEFAVPRAGTYYIAVRSVSDPDQKDMIVKNIRVAATDKQTEVPAAVTGLTVVATSDPDLTATLSFTMPTKFVNGNDIPESATVKARALGAQTVEVAGAPGSVQTLVVPTAQGDNYINVITEVDGMLGQAAEVSVFTGMDMLSYVEKYKAELSEDNMSVRLTWERPIESLNGGYFATTGIRYWIGELDTDGSFIGEPVCAGTDVYEYTLSLPEGSPQKYMRIAIAAENAAGISNARRYIARVVGTPYTLPIIENFDDMTAKYTPLQASAPTDEYVDGSWDWCQPEVVGEEFAHDGGGYGIIGFTDKGNARVRLGLPKVSTVGAEAPNATLELWTGEACAEQMAVYATTHGMAMPEKIADIPAGSGWQKVNVAIPDKFNNRPWMSLYIDGYLPTSSHYLMLYSYMMSPMSSVSDILSGSTGAVYSRRGEIVMAGYDGAAYAVYGIDGKSIAAGTCSGETVVAAAPGIYVVRIGSQAARVIVR